jgi:hypothetical protein
VILNRIGKVVELGVDLQLNQKVYDQLVKRIEPYLIRGQGEFEMTTIHPDPHSVGDATHLYEGDKRQFPRGTIWRQPTAARANRPWPPDQRVSWMADLLPYLGYETINSRIRPNKSWQDPDNVVPSVTLVPAFLDPRSPRGSWYVRYPGMNYDVAATHIVGIAGIGHDAAEYSEKDPVQAKKMGIFGYDRTTKLSDVAGGLANTILSVQVPPSFKTPWIAGGGSTIRGVPETQSIQPFVTLVGPEGKRGTYAVMADGSVRYFSDTTSDDVFKALCTIKKDPSVKIDLEKLAPTVPRPSEDGDAAGEHAPASSSAPQKGHP